MLFLFACIKLTPYRIDDDRIGIVSSTLIPLPEAEGYVISSERKESTETLGRTKKEYQEFYEGLRDRIGEEIPEIRLPEPRPEYLYKIQTGIGGVHFGWAFHGRPRNSFYVELHFERPNAEENKHLLREVAKVQDEVEKVTGEKVIIQENWGPKWSRMYLAKNEGRMTEDLKTWAVKKMTLFYKVLEPKLNTIKSRRLEGSVCLSFIKHRNLQSHLLCTLV